MTEGTPEQGVFPNYEHESVFSEVFLGRGSGL